MAITIVMLIAEANAYMRDAGPEMERRSGSVTARNLPKRTRSRRSGETTEESFLKSAAG